MSLPCDIALSAQRLRELAGLMRGHLNELRAFVGGSERAGQVLTNAKALLACVQAECTLLEARERRQAVAIVEQLVVDECGCRAGETPAILTGGTPVPRLTGKMPVSRPVRAAMIESLHRAGDHSLDDDDFFAALAEGGCLVSASDEEVCDGA